MKILKHWLGQAQGLLGITGTRLETPEYARENCVHYRLLRLQDLFILTGYLLQQKIPC